METSKKKYIFIYDTNIEQIMKIEIANFLVNKSFSFFSLMECNSFFLPTILFEKKMIWQKMENKMQMVKITCDKHE